MQPDAMLGNFIQPSVSKSMKNAWKEIERGSSMITASDYFDKYIPLVHKIFNKYFSDQMNYREDLIQEGYMALWNACGGFDESLGIKFITYAYRAIKNGMVTYIERFIYKYPVQSLDAAISEDDTGSQLSLEDILADEQDTFAGDLIQVCLDRVSTQDRTRLELIMQGYTQDEIALMTNTSQASVSRCLQRFREELLKEMGE